MSRLTERAAAGRAYDAAKPPTPPPQTAGVSLTQRQPSQPPVYHTLNFHDLNEEVVMDNVRIHRNGGRFHIDRHPKAKPEPGWDYSLWADGKDDLSFVIEFLDPVYEWAVHGSCWIEENGVPIPSHPYAWTWYEADGAQPTVKDTSHSPILAPQAHNKYASVPIIGTPTGWIVKAELNVWLGGTGTGPPQFEGSQKRNGFIGGYLTWRR